MAIGAMARGEHGGAPARTVLLVTPHLGLVDQWLRARRMVPSLLPADEPLAVASQTKIPEKTDKTRDKFERFPSRQQKIRHSLHVAECPELHKELRFHNVYSTLLN